MEKVITTALLTIAAVAAAAMLASSLLPTVSRSLGSMATTSGVVQQRIQTDIAIEYVVQNTTSNQLLCWIKNTGSVTIQPVNQMDLILQGPSTYLRIAYGSGSGQWQYTLDSSTWTPGTTASITVSSITLASGQYTLTVTTPNGISVSKVFNV